MCCLCWQKGRWSYFYTCLVDVCKTSQIEPGNRMEGLVICTIPVLWEWGWPVKILFGDYGV